MWKRILSRVILDHPRISVIEDIIELPNGKETEYIRIGKRNDGAMVIAQNNEGKILVLKEYSYPPNKVLYEFPGGAIEDNESPELAAQRELGEEGGVKGFLEQIGWFYVDNRRNDTKMHVYIATNLSTVDAKNDEEESFELFWMKTDEIEVLISNGDFPTYSGLASWALYKNYLKK